jgi:hypothetical protein
MESTNQRWGRAIKSLLENHGLSLRAAAQKVGRPALRTYLADWIAGQIPQYRTEIDFLEHFPRQEAIECLDAAEYPVPREWHEAGSLSDALRGLVEGRAADLPDEGKKQILDFVKEIEEKYRRREGEKEQKDCGQ